jgi:hypothetical protein
LVAPVWYIGRRGDVELLTDDAEKLQGRGATDRLISDWDLELDSFRGKSGLRALNSKPPPKLVHKVLFSMPPGSNAAKVLAAAQNFCREEFALKHRYALALHTDEPHRHVHVVIKAVSEDGQRLNIRKGTLRAWRVGFAHHLREWDDWRVLHVVADATTSRSALELS